MDNNPIFNLADSSIKETAILYYKLAKEKYLREGYEFDRFEFPVRFGLNIIGERHVYQGILKWVWVVYPDGSKRRITINYNHEVKQDGPKQVNKEEAYGGKEKSRGRR